MEDNKQTNKQQTKQREPDATSRGGAESTENDMGKKGMKQATGTDWHEAHGSGVDKPIAAEMEQEHGVFHQPYHYVAPPKKH